MDWAAIFTHCVPEPGAGPEALAAFADGLRRPLTSEEIDEIVRQQRNPFPPGSPWPWQPIDPSGWRLPDRPLPPSYPDLLAFSDGGSFGNGDRWIQLFPTGGPAGVRAMTLAYHLPEYMPGGLPFAFDGSGTFYLFDMRADAGAGGEYPVVAAHAGDLGWSVDECWAVADDLVTACRGTVAIADLR